MPPFCHVQRGFIPPIATDLSEVAVAEKERGTSIRSAISFSLLFAFGLLASSFGLNTSFALAAWRFSESAASDGGRKRTQSRVVKSKHKFLKEQLRWMNPRERNDSPTQWEEDWSMRGGSVTRVKEGREGGVEGGGAAGAAGAGDAVGVIWMEAVDAWKKDCDRVTSDNATKRQITATPPNR